MKKIIAVFMLIIVQAILGLGTANAVGNLHFGYLDDSGSFVAGTHLWSNELRPIPSDVGAFQIQGNAQGNLVDPVKLFLGIAFADNSFVVPNITDLVISNASINIADVQGHYKGGLSNNSGDAYSILSLGDSTNNSQNWTNWSGAYSSLIAPMNSDGFFGIFEYDLTNTHLQGGQTPIGVIFDADLPAGTFMFGWAKFNKTYTTPFTETGMTPPQVPEPATMLLLGLGLLGLAGLRRKL